MRYLQIVMAALACLCAIGLQAEAAPLTPRPGQCVRDDLPFVPGQVTLRRVDCPPGQTCKQYLCFICRDNGAWTPGYPCDSASDSRPANSPPPPSPLPTKQTCNYCINDQGCGAAEAQCLSLCDGLTSNKAGCQSQCRAASNSCVNNAQGICQSIHRCAAGQGLTP